MLSFRASAIHQIENYHQYSKSDNTKSIFLGQLYKYIIYKTNRLLEVACSYPDTWQHLAYSLFQSCSHLCRTVLLQGQQTYVVVLQSLLLQRGLDDLIYVVDPKKQIMKKMNFMFKPKVKHLILFTPTRI